MWRCFFFFKTVRLPYSTVIYKKYIKNYDSPSRAISIRGYRFRVKLIRGRRPITRANDIILTAGISDHVLIFNYRRTANVHGDTHKRTQTFTLKEIKKIDHVKF